MRKLWCGLGLILTMCLGGCLQEQLPPGVVAQVNGESITLREVEALQDVTGSALPLGPAGNEEAAGARPSLLQPGGQAEAIETLRRRYGESLAVLVAQKLIRQTLAREDLGVSPEELAAAENEVRADYPDGEFLKTLQEEYIDEETWREFLHLRLSVLRFQERMLRPLVRVDAEEVAAWYKAHEAEYRLPARVGVVVYAGVAADQMEAVRRELVAGREPELHERLTRQTLRLPLERLAPNLRQDLKTAGQGKPTVVRETDDGLFQVMVQVEEVPARTLSVVQAYPSIEQALLEEKMEPVFRSWLDSALKDAKIQVSSVLLPQEPVEEK